MDQETLDALANEIDQFVTHRKDSPIFAALAGAGPSANEFHDLCVAGMAVVNTVVLREGWKFPQNNLAIQGLRVVTNAAVIEVWLGHHPEIVEMLYKKQQESLDQMIKQINEGVE